MEQTKATTVNPGISRNYSGMGTFHWILVFAFGMSLLVAFLLQLFMFLPFSGIEDTSTSLDSAFVHPNVMLVGVMLSLTTALTLAKYAMHTDTLRLALTSVGVARPSVKPLLWTLLAGAVFMVFEHSVIELAGIDDSALHFGLPAHLNSLSDGVVLFIAACVLAPLYEELVFRGILYERIRRSRLGVTGAIIIPGVVFTLLHIQYDQPVILVLLLLSACLLGMVRYRTGNLLCCMILHAVFNSFAMVSLVMTR